MVVCVRARVCVCVRAALATAAAGKHISTTLHSPGVLKMKVISSNSKLNQELQYKATF